MPSENGWQVFRRPVLEKFSATDNFGVDTEKSQKCLFLLKNKNTRQFNKARVQKLLPLQTGFQTAFRFKWQAETVPTETDNPTVFVGSKHDLP